MAGKTATEELELIEVGGNGGFGEDELPGGGNGGGAAPAIPPSAYFTGMWLALAAILMFFAALTSSFVVRRGLGGDWAGFALPRILWLTTAVLLTSSFTLERARRELASGMAEAFRSWWHLTMGLGLAFLAGQFVAWRQLAAAGVYLASNPSSSFFYVLTGAHGIHLLGGLTALFWVGLRRWPEEARASRQTAVHVTSIYWHFMDGLWVFLFLLLLLGR